jgi:hypothetical protein
MHVVEDDRFDFYKGRERYVEILIKISLLLIRYDLAYACACASPPCRITRLPRNIGPPLSPAKVVCRSIDHPWSCPTTSTCPCEDTAALTTHNADRDWSISGKLDDWCIHVLVLREASTFPDDICISLWSIDRGTKKFDRGSSTVMYAV